MTKIVFCLKRLPGMSRAQCQDYWKNTHAPLVQERASLLGIERYVQSHTLDDASFAKVAESRGGPAAFDGVAEIWFSDQVTGTSAERRQAQQELIDDERRFIDLPASPLFFTQEHEVLNRFAQQRSALASSNPDSPN